MRKAILAGIVILALSMPVEAKPRVADWKWWVMTAAVVGSSIATTATVHRCRHDHGIGACVAGDYGPFPAKETIRLGFSATAIPLSYLWKKQDDEEQRKVKLWWLIPAVPIVINTGTMARNANRHFEPKDID